MHSPPVCIHSLASGVFLEFDRRNVRRFHWIPLYQEHPSDNPRQSYSCPLSVAIILSL